METLQPLFFKTLRLLSAANPVAPCLHKGMLLHVTPLRKGFLTLVSLRLSMHPQCSGLRHKERTQVRETWMQFKRLETHPGSPVLPLLQRHQLIFTETLSGKAMTLSRRNCLITLVLLYLANLCTLSDSQHIRGHYFLQWH